MIFDLKPLPYARGALAPHISANTISHHYDGHHRHYVESLKKRVEGTPFELVSLKQIVTQSVGQMFNDAAQVWNHDFYWSNMSPDGGGEPTGALRKAIVARYGSLSAFREALRFHAGQHFGSGWLWVSATNSGLEIQTTMNADLPMRHHHTALLGCDLWEHAYYLDYTMNRSEYVEVFFDKLVDWDNALRCFEAQTAPQATLAS